MTQEAWKDVRYMVLYGTKLQHVAYFDDRAKADHYVQTHGGVIEPLVRLREVREVLQALKDQGV